MSTDRVTCDKSCTIVKELYIDGDGSKAYLHTIKCPETCTYQEINGSIRPATMTEIANHKLNKLWGKITDFFG